MKLFFCKWPNGQVSIVHARNKQDAVDVLDELDGVEPGWLEEYRGPFFVTFSPAAVRAPGDDAVFVLEEDEVPESLCDGTPLDPSKAPEALERMRKANADAADRMARGAFDKKHDGEA